MPRKPITQYDADTFDTVAWRPSVEGVYGMMTQVIKRRPANALL